MASQNVSIEEEAIRSEQLGPDEPTLEERCSTITFEDMFDYTKAIFNVQISSDWNSADVQAVAWVNGTLADDVRQSLDEYIAQIYPSGDDGWISTDEREGVRAIASECVQYTITRMGMRDGSPHRGGEGTDWKNVSWTEDEVLVEEWNLVPPRHSESRECSGLGSNSDCFEVPVYPNNERDCDTDLDPSSGSDECRLMLWLNATLTISNINDPSQFTLAYNASNMSGAEYHITFPVTEGLRLDMWEECEGRDVEAPTGDYAGTAPIRGSCVGDGSSTHEITENEDGSLTYSFYPEMPQWPDGEDLFADFTTAPIPVDDPPVWTDAAPADGIRFAELRGGSQSIAAWDDIATWFSDEAGVASLDIRCSDDSGDIEVIRNSLHSLRVDVPIDGSLNEFSCEAVDSANQSSGVRTWEIGIPFSVSTSSYVLLDPHPITVTPYENWPDLTFRVVLYQYTDDGGYQRSGPYSLGQNEESFEIPSSAMNPGDVVFSFDIEGEGIEQYRTNSVTLQVSKPSNPPVLAVNSEGWDGTTWSMSGQFSDPDGEAVSFTLLIDGSAVGEVSISGNTWSTPPIDFSVWPEGIHIVEVQACDESDLCTNEQRSVNNSDLFAEPEPEPQQPKDNSSVLPSMGLVGLIIASSAALIYSGRRD